MNRKGFTLVELLATLVILGIVVGITAISISSVFKNTKGKTEGVFVKTLEDALDIYIDSDARKLNFNTNDVVCVIHKTHGDVNLYAGNKKDGSALTFADVVGSSYSPITYEELVNPANKDSEDEEHPYQCDAFGSLMIFRDSDYVYYYKIEKNSFNCLNDDTGYITNLPSECID